MATIDTAITRSTPREAPPLGFLSAFGLALVHAALTTTVALTVVTYGAFIPEPLTSGAVSGWIGELAGLLLLVAVLAYARWWGVTGLRRLAPRRDGWTVLPLAVLVGVGVVVGWVQYGSLLPLGLPGSDGASSLVPYLTLTLVAVASVLLVLAIVPRLIAGRRGRTPVAVVLLTGVVVGLSAIGSEAASAAFGPLALSSLSSVDLGFVAQQVLAQGLVVLPFVAVALRTGSPWLLAPLLLVRLVTVGPAGALFWAYAALGAAYAAWLAVTTPATPANDRPQVPAAT